MHYWMQLILHKKLAEFLQPLLWHIPVNRSTHRQAGFSILLKVPGLKPGCTSRNTAERAIDRRAHRWTPVGEGKRERRTQLSQMLRWEFCTGYFYAEGPPLSPAPAAGPERGKRLRTSCCLRDSGPECEPRIPLLRASPASRPRV